MRDVLKLGHDLHPLNPKYNKRYYHRKSKTYDISNCSSKVSFREVNCEDSDRNDPYYIAKRPLDKMNDWRQLMVAKIRLIVQNGKECYPVHEQLKNR